MARHVLGMGLLAVTVTAQANLASSGFEYVGCVEADPQLFGLNIDFSQPFTPQECQAACLGKATYAAIGGGCRCDVPSQNPDVTFKVLDEGACTVLCIPDNQDAGRCGGSGEGEQPGFQIFNLYKKAGEDSGAGAAAAAPAADAVAAAAAGEGADEHDCDEEVAALNKAAEVPVIVETIYSCPPEKEDCPLRAAEKLPVPVSCPPEGCEPAPVPAPAPAPPATPAPVPAPPATPVPEPCGPEGCAPILNKLPEPCPVDGCRPCPPEGCAPCAEGAPCLPACPEGCIAPPLPEPVPTPTPAPICVECNKPSTLIPAPLVSSTTAIEPPPSPPEPKPEAPSDLPTVVSEAGQGTGFTVEMLTIVGAAIVLLAF